MPEHPQKQNWADLAKKELRGRPLESLSWETPEGITVQPIYTADDMQAFDFTNSLSGIAPYVRGPKATMYVWAPIPEKFRQIGSMKFSEILLEESLVASSPGIGFGTFGEGYLRLSLVENERRIKQALRGIRKMMEGDKVSEAATVAKQ